MAGHEKAVSYVKFLDASTVISASTDNTLKIWDLNRTNYFGVSTSACSMTLKGHTNEKVRVQVSKIKFESYIFADEDINIFIFRTLWACLFLMAILRVDPKQMRYFFFP